jgi:signal transduction histidine kinase
MAPENHEGPPEWAPSAGQERELRELRRRNAELIEAVTARDHFLSVAAHELRNPMTPMLGHVQLLLKVARSADDEKLAQITRGLDRLDRLMRRYVKRATTLLDVSRITAGKFELALVLIDLSSVVREVVQSLAPAAHHAGSPLAVNVADRVHGTWDLLAVEQITDNLLSNAIKYGAGQPIDITLTSDGTTASLRVQDRGIGISKADQARIFDRFERAVTRRAYGGFGIGLWVARQLVHAMGGDIAVTSNPGSGSTFTVTLPISPAPQEGAHMAIENPS